MDCQNLVKCMKKKSVIILIEWMKIYLFYKKDESEIIEIIDQYRILFNNSEELHTTKCASVWKWDYWDYCSV